MQAASTVSPRQIQQVKPIAEILCPSTARSDYDSEHCRRHSRHPQPTNGTCASKCVPQHSKVQVVQRVNSWASPVVPRNFRSRNPALAQQQMEPVPQIVCPSTARCRSSGASTVTPGTAACAARLIARLSSLVHGRGYQLGSSKVPRDDRSRQAAPTCRANSAAASGVLRPFSWTLSLGPCQVSCMTRSICGATPWIVL
jgi:hypothetical protein